MRDKSLGLGEQQGINRGLGLMGGHPVSSECVCAQAADFFDGNSHAGGVALMKKAAIRSAIIVETRVLDSCVSPAIWGVRISRG